MADQISRLRQRLRAASETLAREVDELLSTRGTMIRGSFGTRARVCGNPSCRCTRGELHESKYLSASDGGRVRQVHVPASDEVAVSAGVERYQQWRRLRAQVAAQSSGLVQIIDALGAALLTEYPPGNPLPPPRRRGRKPKGKGDDGEG